MKKTTKIICIAIPFFSAFIAMYYMATYVLAPNILLQKPRAVIFTPTDRQNKDWRESGAHWFSAEDKFAAILLDRKKDSKEAPKGILAIPRGFFKKEPSNPKKITPQQCAELVKNKTFLFYTGSGLSAAAGIPTGEQLKKQLFGFDTQKPVDQLAINILTNPQKVITAQKQFEKTFRIAKPTQAHKAMAHIAFTHKAPIVTSNLDKLHEQSGIQAWNIMSKKFNYFLVFKMPEPSNGNFAYLQANPQWLKKIDFVVCVGMSTDVKGFMAWYKKHNPTGKIIGIDTHPVKYLDDSDYFLQGDAQEIIPALKKALSTKKVKNNKK